MSTFKEKLDAMQDQGKNLCVGIDPDIDRIPKFYFRDAKTTHLRNIVMWFVHDLIEQTKEYAAAFKPNMSFFEQYGLVGDLENLVNPLQRVSGFPPFILDFKRGDIGNTNEALRNVAFERVGADAVTLHPYLGGESLSPLLDTEGKGFFVLCRTSNPGAGEFQDLVCLPKFEDFQEVEIDSAGSDIPIPLYKYVALRATRAWKTNGAIGLVTGGTYPEEIAEIRRLVGDEPVLLIPGIGKQGGDLEKSVHNGMNSEGRNFLINVSSAISYPVDSLTSRDNYLEAVEAAALGYKIKIYDFCKERH